MAGIDNIDCSTFFDHIDDLLDIPGETFASSSAESDFFFGDFKDFPSIWTHSDAFPEPTSENNCTNSASGLSDAPYEEVAQLEWLSNYVEDSFSAGNSLSVDVPNSVPSTVVSPSPTQFPVSVLGSSGSSYVKQGAVAGVPSGGRCGRARSERPRPPTSNRQLISPSTSFTMWEFIEGESFGEFSNSSKIRKSATGTEQKKKKKIKMSVPADLEQNDDPNPLTTLGGEARKCRHCEITKTPQWRAGPNGPKTLCNACGVRYKSGRLFPEYRPAASPTFVPSIHSNSHKKVLELRVKTTSSHADSPMIEDSHTEAVPNKNPLLEYM